MTGRGAQAEAGPYFRGEEIDSYKHIHVASDELPPGCFLLPFGNRWYTVFPQYIPNRCVTYPVPKILQSAGNPVISLAGRPWPGAPGRAPLAGRPQIRFARAKFRMSVSTS